MHSKASLAGDEEMGDYELSEDEGISPGKPTYTGLFWPNLFKTLLFKAKTTANMGITGGMTDTSTEPQDPCTSLFMEQVTVQEMIPSPKFFVDVIQQQWDQPGSIPAPSWMDKRMYIAEQKLEELLKIPTVDALLATMASATILSSSTAEGLKTGQESRAVCL